ncbi:hypothetical protein HanRHA438_Chr10g0467191 [Helianthus annuus]|nr:hypothetical protein HanRHA438_Chr10g0467191 [Helianthus annuus]
MWPEVGGGEGGDTPAGLKNLLSSIDMSLIPYFVLSINPFYTSLVSVFSFTGDWIAYRQQLARLFIQSF